MVLEWPGDSESPALLCAGLQTCRERVQKGGKQGSQAPFINLASLSLSCCSFHLCCKSLGDVGCYPFALAFIREVSLM